MSGATATPDTALARRHLLGLRGLSDADWDGLLEAAEQLTGPAGRRPLLDGLRFGMLFLNPSLRTRTAFDVACHDLGAHAVDLSAGGGPWRLESRQGVVMDGAAAEHVTEALGVLGRMLDGLGLRCFARLEDAAEDAADPVLSACAQASPVPLLNLESATDHPHQGLADALALRRRFAGKKVKVVLSWAPHVRPLPRAVPHAALLAFAREGHEVVLAHPEGFDLDPAVMADAQVLAARRGGGLQVVHEQAAALPAARVVYAKSWGAPAHYGDPAAGAAAVAAHPSWRITPDSLAGTDRAVFMHCLPVRRGVVVDDAVLDGPASLVLEQASARLHVQRATLCRAAGVAP